MKKNGNDKIVYFYHGIVDKNTYLIPRLISSILHLQFIKRLFYIFPGIDQALQKQNVSNENELSLELNPSFVGVFGQDWQIRYDVVERLKQIGAKYVSFHAPYIDDGKAFQNQQRSMMDHVFDATEESQQTTYCLVSHLQLIDFMSQKKEGPVLVIHPLPSSPYKSETDIIKGIAKNINKIKPLLEDLNIFIGIENMPWLKNKHAHYTPIVGGIDFFRNLMNEINHPNVGITFDWGHANTFARYMYNNSLTDKYLTYSEEELKTFAFEYEFLSQLQDKVYHLHLHYNRAHLLDAKPPFYAKNFDYHGDLTQLPDDEMENFKISLSPVIKKATLRSIVLETVPSFLNFNRRLSQYQSSVDILKTMIK